jgi:hypothetical protein
MNSKTSKKKEIVTANISLRTVDGSVIRGKINLENNERVSDVLVNGASPYLIIFDASTSNVDGKVFIVNKQHIIWVEPED